MVSVKAGKSEDSLGQVEHLGAVADIAERRRSEDALAKARAELSVAMRAASMGVMAATIAHEASQPLVGILTNAELTLRMLKREEPNIDGAIQASQRVLRDGNRASEVISRIRNLFRREEGITTTVDLNEAVREVVDLSEFELRRERIVVRQQLCSNDCHLVGDRVQLQQVVLNLLRNAMDAVGEVEEHRRVICLETTCGINDVSFSIEDSGRGFDEELTKRMFDSFYTTKPTGMGIGLSVSRSVIEAHHGKLWCRNRDAGGAVFGFNVPIMRDRGEECNSKQWEGCN